MARISRATMYMDIATAVSNRSTCARLAVGCVITDYTKIVVGYNGPPANHDHCNRKQCNWDNLNQSCRIAVHAEINAIQKINHISNLFPATKLYMYCTHSPCEACTEAIVRLGFIIDSVYFKELFRDSDHLSRFKEAGIKLFKLHPSFQINYFTGQVAQL